MQVAPHMPIVRKARSGYNAGSLHGRVTKLAYEVARWPEPAYVLAVRAGFAQSTLSVYVNGHQEIPAHHLHSLAKIMSKSPSDLLGYIDLP